MMHVTGPHSEFPGWVSDLKILKFLIFDCGHSASACAFGSKDSTLVLQDPRTDSVK